MPGFVPHVTCGASSVTSTTTCVSYVASGSERELPPLGDGACPALALRCVRTTLEVGERRLVWGDQAGARSPLDRHVADRHPLLHREGADRLPRVLDDVADAAGDADLADRPEDHVLRGQAGWQVTLELEQHRLRSLLIERLRREDVLDLGGADAECERAEGAVRRGVAVAAHDRLPGLRQPELRADDVDDSLAPGSRAVELDAELLAVRAQRVELRLRHRVGDRARQASGRCDPSSRP